MTDPLPPPDGFRIGHWTDANARTGGRRDKLVQRAHRTLSFQLSGAQVGISITTLITGYLAEPLVARLLEPVFAAMSLSPRLVGGLALGLARRFRRGFLATCHEHSDRT